MSDEFVTDQPTDPYWDDQDARNLRDEWDEHVRHVEDVERERLEEHE